MTPHTAADLTAQGFRLVNDVLERVDSEHRYAFGLVFDLHLHGGIVYVYEATPKPNRILTWWEDFCSAVHIDGVYRNPVDWATRSPLRVVIEPQPTPLEPRCIGLGAPKKDEFLLFRDYGLQARIRIHRPEGRKPA